MAKIRKLLIVELEVDEATLDRTMPSLATETKMPGGVAALREDPARAVYEASFNARVPGRYGVTIEAFGVREGSFDRPDTIPVGAVDVESLDAAWPAAFVLGVGDRPFIS